MNAQDGADPVRVEKAFPAIVSKSQFQRVGRQLRRRAPKVVHPRRAGSSYLLSGLIKCKTCKRALSGQYSKSGQFPYYVCQSLMKRGKEACKTPRLAARRFEEMVVSKIRSNILTDSNIRALVKVVDEQMDGVAGEHRERLETIQSELADVRRRLDRLYDLVETTDMEINDFRPRIRDHRERQERLEAAEAEARAAPGAAQEGLGPSGDHHRLRSGHEQVPEEERVDGAQDFHRVLRQGYRRHPRQRLDALHHPHFSIDKKSSGIHGQSN